MQQAGTAVYQLDDMDFGRRLALERELDRDEAGPGGVLRTASAVWDESGNFLMYPTMLGIKGELEEDGSLMGQWSIRSRIKCRE
jgi:peptidylprolyl isomerase domain and WD repeat-containing protein 1